MSNHQLIKNESKKIIIIRTGRSSSIASNNQQKSAQIQKYQPTHSITYKNQDHSQKLTNTNSQLMGNPSRQLQKSDTSLLNNQLAHIQNQILDLRLQITRQISEKYELQKQINCYLEQHQEFMNKVYTQINKDYFIQSNNRQNKNNFSNGVLQKISGLEFLQYGQLAEQIIFLSKSNRINQQAVKQQQKYIQSLRDQNQSLLEKVNKLLTQIHRPRTTQEIQTTISQTDDLSISIIKHYSFNNTANSKLINVEVQTDQKRIGLAQTIQNTRSNSKLMDRFNNIRISPYKHYLVTPQNRSKITISKQRKYQNVDGQTPKKINLQSIKDKRLNQKNVKDKKRIIASSPYINHLLMESKQLTIEETITKQGNQETRLNIHLQNPKSQLTYRRPIHRSRSHSQQQIILSSQRSRSNNSSSRVLSSYSINPLNKYGNKRFCNQVNGQKIRKISRLSQQSEQLQQRLKQLQNQQKKLEQKYNLLAQMKLMKQVTVNRSRSKCNPLS